MKDNKEKWIKQVLESTRGYQKAQPKPNLFSEIEQQIYAPHTKLISMQQWSMAAAIAVVFLTLNAFTIHYQVKSNTFNEEEIIQHSSGQQLFLNYNLYD